MQSMKISRLVFRNIRLATLLLWSIILCLAGAALLPNDSHAAGIFGDAKVLGGKVTSELGSMVDPFGRETPRSTVQGFILSLAEDDAALAANYLDLDPGQNGIQQVRLLKLALDNGGRIYPDLQLSNDPAGNLADKLPSNLEKVGTIQTSDQIIDLLLKREESPHGNRYWQVAPETLLAVQQAKLSLEPTVVSKFTIKGLQGKSIGGYQLSDITAVVVLIVLTLLINYVFVWLLYLLTKTLYPIIRRKRLPIDAKVIVPLALVLTSIILSEVMVYAGVSVTVREPANRIKDIVGWLASTWLLLRVTDAIFQRAERQSCRRNQTERVSILSLLHKVVKAVLLILATIFIFGNLGFDLTTGIAALGVGGLALALGAQKMIENLVGSVVVVADQPVRVGDYCKFGSLEGTVIDIGIRSTRVRTLDRTVMTVPNGDFSSMSIENFAARDMFHFLHRLYLKPGVEADILAVFLDKMNDFLDAHELTNKEWNQVRIVELRQDCIVIEVRAYIYATGAADFYDKQSKLIVALLREVENYPVEHALPAQEVVIDSLVPGKTEAIEAKKLWLSNQVY